MLPYDPIDSSQGAVPPPPRRPVPPARAAPGAVALPGMGADPNSQANDVAGYNESSGEQGMLKDQLGLAQALQRPQQHGQPYGFAAGLAPGVTQAGGAIREHLLDDKMLEALKRQRGLEANVRGRAAAAYADPSAASGASPQPFSFTGE
jgi:hypothetical protein